MQTALAPRSALFALREIVQPKLHGFLVAAVIAAAAQFLSDHYGAPAMLMALLLGIAFHFLSEEGACKPGIDFTARTVLRFGVALLGARISVELIVGLGPQLIFVVIAAVILTLLFGLAAARLLGRGWRFGLLTGGSVALGWHRRLPGAAWAPSRALRSRRCRLGAAERPGRRFWGWTPLQLRLPTMSGNVGGAAKPRAARPLSEL